MNGKERQVSLLNSIQRTGVIAGLLAAIAGVAGLLIAGPAQFFHSYLVAEMYWLGITLGAMAVGLISYLVVGHWSAVVRRTAVSAARNMVLMAVLFIPILLGLRNLYPWMAPNAASNPLFQHLSPYLNLPFFLIRVVIYFAVWIFIASRLNSVFRQHEHTVETEISTYRRTLSAPGIIAYMLTMTFAAIDWLMAMYPGWHSSAYGPIIILTQASTGMAFVLVTIPILAVYRPFRNLVWATFPGSTYFRDLGALLLVGVMLLMYIAYFEFLIQWAGNIPAEVEWWLIHSEGGMVYLLILALTLQFVIPFIFLITPWAKRDGRILTLLAASILLGVFLYLIWQIEPALHPKQFYIHWLDIVLPLAVGGFWLASFAWNLKRTPGLVLEESSLPAATSGQEGTPA